MLKNSEITRMSLEEFRELMLSLDELRKRDNNGDYRYFNLKIDNQIPTEELWIINCWTIGGVTGNSCWGTEARPRNGEPEPDFVVLEKILSKVCKDISFLEYKALLRNVDMREDYGQDDADYYGNYSEQCIKAINVKKLYDCLREMAKEED